MSGTSHTRTDIVALLAILTISAISMVWLFWHYPLVTTVITAAVLIALGLSARLARSIDAERSELERKHSV